MIIEKTGSFHKRIKAWKRGILLNFCRFDSEYVKVAPIQRGIKDFEDGNADA
jgi:hypothetical protein